MIRRRRAIAQSMSGGRVLRLVSQRVGPLCAAELRVWPRLLTRTRLTDDPPQDTVTFLSMDHSTFAGDLCSVTYAAQMRTDA